MNKLVSIVIAFVLVGCTSHIAPYKPKRRKFDPGLYATAPTASNGSLYAVGDAGWFDDVVASRIGDILVIRIDERDGATRNASTKLDKQDESSYGLPAALGLVAALKKRYPDADPTKLFATDSERKFSGNGSIERNGRLQATLPVRVMQVVGNGDLFVEGTKVVMVGAEEHHVYISGVVRRADIAEDNTVPSSRVADAEIEYTGRGDVTDTQRRGWAARLFDKVWPF
jgi:flagellar L-ring protein precursor FlgH